jgi:peptidoglycan/xylan/chitin deacetylase (PgdA/CDA1 family)
MRARHETSSRVNLLRRGATAVLMYHSIAASARDPHLLSVSPDRFAAQLESLGHLADVVPLAQVGAPSACPRIVITFDDGYANNLTLAEPLLRSAQMPATVFVATDNVAEPAREFWADRLEHILLDAEPPVPRLVVEPAGHTVSIDVRTPAGRLRAYHLVSRMLRRLPVPTIETKLVEIAEQLGSTARVCPEHRMMTRDEVRRLAATGLVEVGGHTISHSMLSGLSPDDQRHEVGGGRTRLQGIIGRPVNSFAYPFGEWGAFDRASVAAVREAGYARACTTRIGLFYPTMSRFRIPRFMVLDWDEYEFASNVKRWLNGDR